MTISGSDPVKSPAYPEKEIQMIQKNFRNGKFQDTLVRPIQEAIKCLIEADFAWGAQIVDFKPGYVKTEVNFMGCHDITEYMAETDEEKQALNVVAAAWAKATTHFEAVSADAANSAMEITKGNPGLLNMFAPLLIGKSMLKKMSEVLQEA